jgi:hypothetical protein
MFGRRESGAADCRHRRRTPINGAKTTADLVNDGSKLDVGHFWLPKGRYDAIGIERTLVTSALGRSSNSEAPRTM